MHGHVWWLPESPRWLIVKGRHQEALKVMTQVAKVNGKTLPPDHQVLAAMKVIGQKTVLQPVVEEEGKRTGRVLSRAVQAIERFFILFILPEFRVRTLVVIYCCCSASLVYYGLALNSNNINAVSSQYLFCPNSPSTDPYMYVFLGGLLEVPSYVLLWPALIYIGRKKSLVALYFLCGIFIFLVMTLILLEPAGGDWAVVIFSQSGKVVITAAYQLVAIYTAELYPTKYRSLAMGMTGAFAMGGGMASPYINDILGMKQVWGPSALFGSVSFMAGALTLLLPETRHLDLSETTNFSTTKVTEEEGKKNVSTNNNVSTKETTKGVTNLSYVGED
ncbi:Solute carrier family 22 member 21 [Chionoecetes opilio]|uniref:Solute carrier family 22 member 21 n=1 Tax=Chionoecetes opilio TaxID=41210 RepID=A0A8J4Y7U9_CHIOP|nr:Solute carrier family 22 member 21 [Chionoecetes opilio]